MWGGAGWARLGQYVDSYRAAGHTVVVGTLWKDEAGLSVAEDDGTKTYPDVLILQRIMHGGVDDAIRFGQSCGQVIINDLDDWYWGLDPANSAFQASHPKRKVVRTDLLGRMYEDDNPEHIGHYGANLAASDLLTVSTPYLADRISRKVRCPIVVIPNYVDVARFTPVQQTDDRVPLFGWAGSTSHRSGDIETVAGVLGPRIKDGSIRMHHSGHLDGSPTLASMLGVPEDLVQTSPRCTATEYPSMLTFEVGIVPLRDTPFNHAKSEIKGLEYAAAGIPFIAQGLSAYAQLHNDWGSAFWLADRPKDWITGTKRYLDPVARKDAQEALLDLVKSRDLHYGAQAWLDVLEGAR